MWFTQLRAVCVLFVGMLLLLLPLRRDVSAVVGPALRPLRIAQSWGVYGTGPRALRHFEVWADDARVYRARDADDRWRAATFTYRRIRPSIVHTCLGDGKNKGPLLEWVVREARSAFPDAKKIVMRCTKAKFPGRGTPQVEFEAFAEAPGWRLAVK